MNDQITIEASRTYRLRKAQQHFEENLDQKRSLLQQYLREAVDSSNARRALRNLSHQLAGSCRSFGYTKAGMEARSLELYLYAVEKEEQILDVESLQRLGNALDEALKEGDSVPAKETMISSLLDGAPLYLKEGKPLRALIVEDDLSVAILALSMLEEVGIQGKVLHEGSLLLRELENFQPDMLIVDLQLPYYHGFDLVRVLRSDLRHKHLPIVVMSSLQEDQVVEDAYRFGADSFIAKPLVKRLFQLRILSFMQTNAAFTSACDSDSLTQLHNRRAFVETYQREVKGEMLHSLVMIDIDQFKEFNHTYGHSAGDAALKAFACCLRENLPENAYAARWGGEEFTLLFLERGGEDVKDAVETLRIAWKKQVQDDVRMQDMNFSCGIAVYPYDGEELEALFHTADLRMYQAKKEGGKRTISCL